MAEPIKKFRVGSVTAAVWRNDNGSSVTIQKSFKDDKGEWKNTETLFHADVLCAIKALERAEEFLSK